MMEFYTEYVYASRFILTAVVFTVLFAGMVAGWVLRGLGVAAGGRGRGGVPPAPSPVPPQPPRVAHCRRQVASALVLDAQARANHPERPLTPKERASFRRLL